MPSTGGRADWRLVRRPALVRSKAGRGSSEDDKPFAAPNKRAPWDELGLADQLELLSAAADTRIRQTGPSADALSVW